MPWPLEVPVMRTVFSEDAIAAWNSLILSLAGPTAEDA